MIDNNEDPSSFPIGLEEKVINAVLAERTNEWRIFRMDFRWAGDDLFAFVGLTDGKQVILDGCYCGSQGQFNDPSLPIVVPLKLQDGIEPTFVPCPLSVAELVALNDVTVIVCQRNGFHRVQRLQGKLTFVDPGAHALYGKIQYGEETKILSFTNDNALTPKTETYSVNIDGVDHVFQRGQRIVLLPSI